MGSGTASGGTSDTTGTNASGARTTGTTGSETTGTGINGNGTRGTRIDGSNPNDALGNMGTQPSTKY